MFLPARPLYAGLASDDSPWLQARGFWNDSAVSSHGLCKNIQRGIMISIDDETTCGALVHPNLQGYVLLLPACATGLRRIGR
jgi:hypothetical protein